MNIPLTERVQASIIALQAYSKWLWANKVATFGPQVSRDDADESAEKGYWRTIRPEGTDGSDSCFYAAKRYPITDTLDTPRRCRQPIPHSIISQGA